MLKFAFLFFLEMMFLFLLFFSITSHGLPATWKPEIKAIAMTSSIFMTVGLALVIKILSYRWYPPSEMENCKNILSE
jgi:hypothetical protein